MTKKYSGEFKAKVALEAHKGKSLLSDLQKKFKISSATINRWKVQLEEDAKKIFIDYYANIKPDYSTKYCYDSDAILFVSYPRDWSIEKAYSYFVKNSRNDSSVVAHIEVASGISNTLFRILFNVAYKNLGLQYDEVALLLRHWNEDWFYAPDTPEKIENIKDILYYLQQIKVKDFFNADVELGSGHAPVLQCANDITDFIENAINKNLDVFVCEDI